MAASSFEFVRLVVLPKIRPPGFDETAQIDVPEEGVYSISGTGGGVIDLPFSYSSSWTKSHHKEQKRKYDVVRAYYTSSDGGVDKNTYVDFEALHEVKWGNGDKDKYSKAEIKENMELMETDQTRNYKG